MALISLIVALLSLMVACVALWPQLSVRRRDADRRHDELTPQIELRCQRLNGHRAELTVALTGPDSLGDLDTIEVCLDDDHPRTPVTAGTHTQQDLDHQLWGPYRFSHLRDRERTASLTGVGRGTVHKLALETTAAPPWVPTDHWRQDYEDKPVIATLVCHRRGHRPWTLARRRIDVQA
jgi:hypothetical protein